MLTSSTNKSKTRAIVLFSLIAALAPSSVMAQAPRYFTIPFDFTVGQKSFAAGDYRVAELAPHVILIRSVHGHDAAMVLAIAAEPGKIAGQATLTFHRYGARYFLARVADANSGSELRESAGEKELNAARAAPRSLAAIASSGR